MSDGIDDKPSGMRRRIDASSLTTFDVDPNGQFARLHLRDESGSPATVKLPVSCLTQLLMTLPKMVQMALRNRSGDTSLRLVHSLDHFSLELSEPDAGGRHQLILTLRTGEGFDVSFAASEGVLSAVANAILTEGTALTAHPPAPH